MKNEPAITSIIILVLLALTLLSPMFAGYSSAAYSSETTPDSWVTKMPMPTTRDNLGVAAVNGKIYAIGGERHPYNPGDITYFNHTEEYDPSTDNWTKKQVMPTPRSSFAIAVYGGKIYLFGGATAGYPGPVFMGGKTLCALNQVYDPATDTWQTKTPLPENRAYLSANVVDDKIYLIGGLSAVSPGTGGNSSIIANTTLIYDPARDSWTTKAPISTPVFYYASAVVNGKIYIISGNTGPLSMATFGGFITNLTQIYDPATDSWSYGASIPTGVQNAAATSTGIAGTAAIYTFSGFEGFMIPSALKLTQVYYPENDSWSTGAKMQAAQFGMRAAAVNNTIYVICGTENSQYLPFESQVIPVPPSPSLSPSPSPYASLTPTFTPATFASPSPSTSPSPSEKPAETAKPTQWRSLPQWVIVGAVLSALVVISSAVVFVMRKKRKTK